MFVFQSIATYESVGSHVLVKAGCAAAAAAALAPGDDGGQQRLAWEVARWQDWAAKSPSFAVAADAQVQQQQLETTMVS